MALTYDLFNLRMIKIKKLKITLGLFAIALLLQSCAVTYGFKSGSIDYTKTKSISITDFPNNADLVNPTLSQTFIEALKDKYTRSTRLQLLPRGGDMHLEGEIVGYQLSSMAISADSYASQTKLTLTINVRFTNNKKPEDDITDVKYSAFQMFNSDRMLNDVEPELVKTMVDEIVDKIFNDSVAKW